MKISIKSHNREFTGELSDESTLDEIIDVIEGLLITSGFHPETFKQSIIEKSYIYEQEEKENREKEKENKKK